MRPYAIAGIGTDVGKTVVSAIVCEALNADYWKPVQCHGNDSQIVREWVSHPTIHPCTYTFEMPASPHQAAKFEGKTIDPAQFRLPATKNPLVIEMCGGLMVPLTDDALLVEQMKNWDCAWILVSRHYLGSINHTLLSHHYMQAQGFHMAGIIFNGPAHPDTERAILIKTGLTCLGRLDQQPELNLHVVQRIAKEWKPSLLKV